MAKLTLMIVLLAAAGAVAVAIFLHQTPAPIPPPAIVTTAPTSQPATAPIVRAPRIDSYIDVVRAQNPAVATTQLLAMPVALTDAAHILLHDPVYLDPLGHLWITRADAPQTERTLRRPSDSTEHLLAERPAFVHWWTTDNGDWRTAIIAPKTTGGWELITSLNREPLPTNRPYRWNLAFSWDAKIVVPTDVGISIFELQPTLQEHFHALPGMSDGHTQPITTLDARGLLAWAPQENGRPGSAGVSRFVSGAWTDLPTDQWPPGIIQLVSLLDGSILQIIAGDSDTVRMAIVQLETSDIDPRHISDLIDQLADPDDNKRQAAFSELSRYGPGLWPLLEKTGDDIPPETRIRLKQLLQGKIAPALNGMTFMQNRLTVAARQDNGTALLYAPIGVEMPTGQDKTETISPAWIVVRPSGRIDRPLPQLLVADQQPGACHLVSAGDEWLICDETGARRFMGNSFVSLLQPGEEIYSRFIGIDRRARWLFRRPDPKSTETLLIDPTIQDPTPKLPVWTMVIHNGSVGWDSSDYPAIKRGGIWKLTADAWAPLPDKSHLLTEPPPPPPATTQPTTGPSEPPLLVSSDGTQYFDGRTALITLDKSNHQTRWPLPALAQGTIDPTLLRTADGHLFLFNSPGRVLRLKPTSDPSEPFQLEASFTRDIPNTDHPTRIWLDPAGRIDFEFDGNTLAVMFPSGQIPNELSEMMPANP